MLLAEHELRVLVYLELVALIGGEPAPQLAANDHRVSAPPFASGPICAAPKRSDLPPLGRIETT
jgi:hypothetical protein